MRARSVERRPCLKASGASSASPAAIPQPDNPLRGIALSAGACAVFAIADTTSKYLSTGMPIIEIQWIRYVLFFGMAATLWRARLAGRCVRAIRSCNSCADYA